MEFAPIVYEHAARFVGKSPWEVSRSSELLFQAHSEAFRFYRHSPVVVGIDIYNLEAEGYGAVVDRPLDNTVPSISNSVCASAQAIPQLDYPNPNGDGRIPMVIEAGERLKQEFPQADVRIPLSGPFSIVSHLLGLETLLLEALDAPDALGQALDFLVAGQIEFCKEIVQRDLGIILFESAAAPPLLSPQIFREVVLAPLKTLIQQGSAISDTGVPCVVGGNTVTILDAILETGTNYVICPLETDQKVFLEQMQAYPDVMVRVNMNSGVFTSENPDLAEVEADRILELVRGRRNVCIGTGVLPFQAIPGVVMKTKEYVHSRLL
jgi:uroporphyrinogen decarboxylase